MIGSLVEHFTALDDPRCARKVEHGPVDVWVVSVCAVVAEAETFEDIALYGRCKEGWLRRCCTDAASGAAARCNVGGLFLL